MHDVPRLARLLGLGGLLPQILFLLVALFGPTVWQSQSRDIGAFYAALVLAFIGGAWWGIAAGAPAAERRGGLGWLWLAGAAPLLGGLIVLGGLSSGHFPRESVLMMLGGAMLISLGVDLRATAMVPHWWMRLRVPLSVSFGAATIALALA